MITAILEGRCKNDYINFRGENVSKLWREINKETPNSPEKLGKSDFSFSPDFCRGGSNGEFYSFGNSIGGKRLMFSDYNSLRSEFMKYELAERLESNILPEKYGLMLVRNEESNKDVPMIVSRDLGDMSLNSPLIDGKYFEYDASKKFKEKAFKISKHLKYFDRIDFEKVVVDDIYSKIWGYSAFKMNDIGKHNAIYSVEDSDTYLIDSAFWSFLGLEDKNVF